MLGVLVLLFFFFVRPFTATHTHRDAQETLHADWSRVNKIKFVSIGAFGVRGLFFQQWLLTRARTHKGFGLGFAESLVLYPFEVRAVEERRITSLALTSGGGPRW